MEARETRAAELEAGRAAQDPATLAYFPHANPGPAAPRRSEWLPALGREPGDTRRRWPWFLGGVSLELAAIATMGGLLAHEARYEDPMTEATRYSIRLAWQDVLHQRRVLAVVIAAAIAYLLGAVLLAVPFARRRRSMLVAVPLLALTSILVLGVLAALVLLVVGLIALSDGSFDLGWGGGGRRRARAMTPAGGAPAGQNAGAPAQPQS